MLDKTPKGGKKRNKNILFVQPSHNFNIEKHEIHECFRYCDYRKFMAYLCKKIRGYFVEIRVKKIFAE